MKTSKRRRELGLCRCCTKAPEINPITNYPYVYCKEHRIRNTQIPSQKKRKESECSNSSLQKAL